MQVSSIDHVSKIIQQQLLRSRPRRMNLHCMQAAVLYRLFIEPIQHRFNQRWWKSRCTVHQPISHKTCHPQVFELVVKVVRHCRQCLQELHCSSSTSSCPRHVQSSTFGPRHFLHRHVGLSNFTPPHFPVKITTRSSVHDSANGRSSCKKHLLRSTCFRQKLSVKKKQVIDEAPAAACSQLPLHAPKCFQQCLLYNPSFMNCSYKHKVCPATSGIATWM